MTSPHLALIAPLHDPEGHLVGEIEALAVGPAAAAWRALRSACRDVVLVASPQTAEATSAAFERAGGRIERRREQGAGEFMWLLAEGALAMPASHFFMPDADRLLHWLLSHPEEIAGLPAASGGEDVLSLTRSERAFASHPACQRLTEGPIRRLIERAIGVPGADPFSGAYWLSRRALEAVLASDSRRDESFYAEVFLAPARAGCTFAVRTVEGLEWETPDRHRAEIDAVGYDEWLRRFESPAQWERRVGMLAMWVERLLAHDR